MNFNTLWARYPKKQKAPEVYQLIGGKVLWNHQSNPVAFANSCSLRLSYALNYANEEIPYQSGVGSGLDKKWYFYRVKDLTAYIRKKLGAPTITRTPADSDYAIAFSGKKGIILFEVQGWGDATGHITLWNGIVAGDKAYFAHSTPNIKTTKVSLWLIS